MEEIKKHLPLHCPGCGKQLNVSCLFCTHCKTEVHGSFKLPLLARLDEEAQTFIVDFIKTSGSLKDMAKKMGISYPTLRNHLDDLIVQLNKLEAL
jgi:hypothetical protein